MHVTLTSLFLSCIFASDSTPTHFGQPQLFSSLSNTSPLPEPAPSLATMAKSEGTEAISLLGAPTDPSDAAATTTGDGRSRDRRANSGTLTLISPSVNPARSGRPATKTSSKRRVRPRGTVAPLFRRTWTLPLALMLGFVALYAVNPTESNIARHFLFLSYQFDDEDGQARYGKGAWDFAFIFFYTIFLSFTREFVMHEVLRPLAVFGGIKSRGKQSRFTEQMYTACYIAFVGPLGLYTMKQTPGLWFFETRGMYETYPHTTHTAVFKFYYLFQAAFWVQQVVVMLLGQEKPRKDFKELIAHHIITISLIYFSYRYHFTHIGIAIYITHDISDFFLAVSSTFAIPSARLTHRSSRFPNRSTTSTTGPSLPPLPSASRSGSTCGTTSTSTSSTPSPPSTAPSGPLGWTGRSSSSSAVSPRSAPLACSPRCRGSTCFGCTVCSAARTALWCWALPRTIGLRRRSQRWKRWSRWRR